MILLGRLDKFFDTKKESEKWLMVIATVLMVGYISSITLVPISQQKYREVQQQLEATLREIEMHRDYLIATGDREVKVKQYAKTMEELRRDIKALSLEVEYVRKRFKEGVKGVEFKKLIDAITQKAEESGVVLMHMTTPILRKQNGLTQGVKVGFQCHGGYGEIVKFIIYLEEGFSIANVSEVSLWRSHKGVRADINVTFWGGR
jgi:hypothetical protein